MPDHGKIALIIGIDQYDIGLDPLPSSKKIQMILMLYSQNWTSRALMALQS